MNRSRNRFDAIAVGFAIFSVIDLVHGHYVSCLIQAFLVAAYIETSKEHR